MFRTLFTLGKMVNTLSTAYVVGQIGWKAFREIRKMQQEKMRASEIKARYVEIYFKKHEKLPTEEEIQLTLDAVNAVDRPVQHRASQLLQYTQNKINECVTIASEVASEISNYCASAHSDHSLNTENQDDSK